uniref:Dolichyl-diphosphooligosaccharide--protein glycosyltransferase subunit 2 n=1 Tax=Haemonchus contortus TaxID=6289 RepID=A0A7I4XVM3_HAECO
MIYRMESIVIAVCNVAMFGLLVSVSGVRIDITPQGGSSPVMGNSPLTPSQASSVPFSFSPDKEPDSPGFYNVNVKVESQDERHVGLTSSSTTLKSFDEVMVEDFKVGALEKDDVVSGANLVSVAQFSKYEKVIAADSTKRLYMSFSVKSKVSRRLVQPHQAFILFKHVNGGEVFYTADVQTGGKYLVDIDLARAHKDFEGVSGKYTAYLIIGDATIRTSLNWPFAEFMLTLPPTPVEVVPKSQRINYDKLPEIEHIFRLPEKRPSTVVSDAFTLICLSPLLLLLVLWLRIGVNIGNMPLNGWTLLFHGSLAGHSDVLVIYVFLTAGLLHYSHCISCSGSS